MNLDLTQLVAIAAALGWASGLRLYAVVFITGMAGRLGGVELPGDLHVLAHPIVLGAAGADALHRVLRRQDPGPRQRLGCDPHVRSHPGLAQRSPAPVFGGDQASWVTAAALMGGTLAATSHAPQPTTRASANTSPEPFSNIALSLLGDGAVPFHALAVVGASVVVSLVVLAAVVVAEPIVVVWVLWRFIARLMRRMRLAATSCPRSE